MVIRIGLIKIIFTVHLWKLCSTKFIENESFVRTFRVNVSESEEKILNVSLSNVLDLHNQTQNSTTEHVNLRREVRMRRKLDNIGRDRYFYVRSRDINGMENKNPSSTYYINYQKAYGIRYDPRKIKRSFSFKDSEDDDLSTTEPFTDSTTIFNDLQQDDQSDNQPGNQDEDVNDAEEGFLSSTFQNHTNWPTDLNETNNLLDESHFYNSRPFNVTTQPFPIVAKPFPNVAKPSKIETALQHLNMKIKNLFSLNINADPNTQRFLNVFNVIKFPNVPCLSASPPLTQLNGICYHKYECDQLGGIATDSCAGGFGVCCIFQFGCGGTTNQNVSYFKNPDYPAATKTRLICTFTVELWPNVNQVFIEFLFFELKAPVDGSCVDDQFIVAGQSPNNLIPILCGINTGQHMYVDVESSLDRKVYLSVLAATPDSRAFNIRISQVQSGDGQAPQNCLQYYQDESGIIQTFNYDDASAIIEYRQPTYFNNLNYAICIKRLPGYCLVQYTNTIGKLELDFQLVNVDRDGTSVIPSGQAGAEIYNCADDFIAINGIRLCGDKLNDASVTEDFTRNAPVTDYTAGPIIIPVRTNDAVVGRGFKIIFNQLPCQDVTE